MDSMAIDVARGARGTRPFLISQKIYPIWPPRLHEIIQMSIIPSGLVIVTYVWTLYLGYKAWGI